MIFAMPNKPGEFSRFDFPEVLPAPINGRHVPMVLVVCITSCACFLCWSLEIFCDATNPCFLKCENYWQGYGPF